MEGRGSILDLEPESPEFKTSPREFQFEKERQRFPFLLLEMTPKQQMEQTEMRMSSVMEPRLWGRDVQERSGAGDSRG